MPRTVEQQAETRLKAEAVAASLIAYWGPTWVAHAADHVGKERLVEYLEGIYECKEPMRQENPEQEGACDEA